MLTDVGLIDRIRVQADDGWPWGALHGGPGGPRPTQNCDWVGHNTVGPRNN